MEATYKSGLLEGIKKQLPLLSLKELSELKVLIMAEQMSRPKQTELLKSEAKVVEMPAQRQ